MRKLIIAFIVVVAIVLSTNDFAIASIGFYSQGGVLSNTVNYDWWYGCSPTSAGMMMGHYDRNGYDGYWYNNLVPGGVAETNTFGVGPYLANAAIASAGHITDFYSGGTNASNDDVAQPWHDFDCLADFMGTSQDLYGQANGWSSFTYFTDGSRYYEADSGAGEGMYGVGQYVDYAGYDALTLYNQLLPGVADDLWGYTPNTLGFTLADYQAEIDAGRPVMIQIEGHSMFGYGYTAGTQIINVYDTWNPAGQNPGTLTWGGLYGTELHYGVMVLEVTGSTAGDPSARCHYVRQHWCRPCRLAQKKENTVKRSN